MTDQDLQFLAGRRVHLMLSLPGMQTYAEHTGGGDPETVLELFARASALGIRTTVGVTVTRRNLHEVFETVGEALLAGANELLLNRFLPGGRGLAHWRDLALDEHGLRTMMREAEAALRAARRNGHVGTELPGCALEAREGQRLRVGTRCGAANDFFVVDPSGYIRVCNHSPVRLLPWSESDRLWDLPRWRLFALHQHEKPGCEACVDLDACDAGCPEAAAILAEAGGHDAMLEQCRTRRFAREGGR
jgi:radical SAM protein with 4Fe4S-binding SPASM domain